MEFECYECDKIFSSKDIIITNSIMGDTICLKLICRNCYWQKKEKEFEQEVKKICSSE